MRDILREKDEQIAALELQRSIHAVQLTSLVSVLKRVVTEPGAQMGLELAYESVSQIGAKLAAEQLANGDENRRNQILPEILKHLSIDFPWAK